MSKPWVATRAGLMKPVPVAPVSIMAVVCICFSPCCRWQATVRWGESWEVVAPIMSDFGELMRRARRRLVAL